MSAAQICDSDWILLDAEAFNHCLGSHCFGGGSSMIRVADQCRPQGFCRLEPVTLQFL